MAEHGGAGSGQLQHGKNGADIILDVPLGTVAKNAETGEILFELVEPNEERILVRVVAEVLETTTSRQRHTRRLVILSLASPTKKDGSSSNLNYLRT